MNDLNNPTSEDTSKIPRPWQPGDNPNKLNAKRRLGNRPKSRNTPPGKAPQMSFSWAEPCEVNVPIPAIGIEANQIATPVGEVELDPFLPETISTPFSQLMETLGQRTNIPKDKVEYCSAKLESLSYYKSARQLYSTLNDADKSKLQPLKAVYYESSEIPKHMGAAISMIGDFDSKVGKVEVRDSVTLFRRWVLKGLSKDPDGDIEEVLDGREPLKAVWNDRAGKATVDRLARERLARMHDDEYTLSYTDKDNLDHEIRVCPPLFIEGTQDEYSRIPASYQNADEMRDLIALLIQDNKAWRAEDDLPNGRSIEGALSALDVWLASDELNDANLRLSFEEAMSEYYVGGKPHIASLFNLGPSPATGVGYAAQIVQSDDVQAHWDMPIADSDLNLGFVFNPNKSFRIRPKFVGYSKRRRDALASQVAEGDAKAIAL